MLGKKERDFKTHRAVSLDELVPEVNFYRQLESKLDLNFVRDLVREYYAVGLGRPSVDPVVFFKLQLILFFEGFRSERQLMEQVHLNLAMRWYIGYDLDEDVPNHSTLSKIRDRFGLEVFQRFFEQIVQMCIDAGLVWGEELHFDGSLILANADYDKQVPRFFHQAQQHLQQMFKEGESDKRDLLSKYDGSRQLVKPNAYVKKSDYWVSPVDEHATPAGNSRLGYHLQYVVDGGKSRIILKCLATPAAIQDNTPMLDLAWMARFRWQLALNRIVADRRFGTVENVVALEQNAVRAFIPLHTEAKRSSGKRKTFPANLFQYDPQQDSYICPQDQVLNFWITDTHSQRRIYKAPDEVCAVCPVKAKCKIGKSGRRVGHSMFKDVLDRVQAYQQTAAYQKAMRKRQVWIEPKFAELKMWHQGRRFRLRGLFKVNIEALLKAAGQNIKQLLKTKTWQNRPNPPASAAISRPILMLFRAAGVE